MIQTDEQYTETHNRPCAVCGRTWDETNALAEIEALEQDLDTATTSLVAYVEQLETARAIEEWHDDDGSVLWWRFPVLEAPYCGSPLNEDWIDGYYTHWTPLVVPKRFMEKPPAPKEDQL